MTRRGLFTLFFGTQQDSVDELAWNLISFDKPYGRFARDLFGCGQEGPVDLETCRPSRRQINYKEFGHAREAAKKLFDLKD